ncbi:MAG: hypothetical protein V4616_05910 [Bacteroidota bacterium]
METRKWVLVLFALGFVLITVAITLMETGLWRQTALFVGFVSAIAAMIFLIAGMVKHQ